MGIFDGEQRQVGTDWEVKSSKMRRRACFFEQYLMGSKASILFVSVGL